MANSELPALAATTTIAATDLFYVVVDPGGGGEADKKMAYSDLLAEIKTDVGVYANYTPTVAQNGTRTTSALTGRYYQIGKHVHAYGSATISDSGTAGNVLTVTVPVSAAGGFGSGLVFDTSASDQWTARMVFQSATTVAFYVTNTTGNTGWGSIPSLAVASGDTLFWDISYEAS